MPYSSSKKMTILFRYANETLSIYIVNSFEEISSHIARLYRYPLSMYRLWDISLTSHTTLRQIVCAKTKREIRDEI